MGESIINTTITNTTLEENILNESTLYLRIPALIFLAITIITGVLGHSAIIYIYGFRMKRTNVFLFINLLSLSDLTSCTIVVPLEIYRIRIFYAYHDVSVCKLETYVLFACYINSTTLLLIISIERYMRVCRSTSRQMEFSVARKIGVVCAMLGAILAIPSWIWTTPRPFLIDDYIISNRCSPYLDMNVYTYAIVVFGVSFIIWAIMLVLYLRILKTIKKQAHWHVEASVGPRKRSSMKLEMDQKLSRTNRTIICVTVVFVCTCTFYFCFILVNMISRDAMSTHNMHYLLFLLNETWVINVMFNPFVFGFMNTEFRMELFKILGIKYTAPDNEIPDVSSISIGKNLP